MKPSLRLMSTLLVLAGLVTAGGPAQAAPVPVPVLPAQATQLKQFVPPGWVIEQQLKGDLDGDGRADRVLVLQASDPANIVRDNRLPPDVVRNLNPRLLAIVLAQKSGYRLALQNSTLIPHTDDPALADPLAHIAISNGRLLIRIELWSSMGSYSSEMSDFTFELDQECLHLTQYKNVSEPRNRPDVITRIVRFSDRGHDEPLPGPRRKPGPCIDTLGDGWRYTP